MKRILLLATIVIFFVDNVKGEETLNSILLELDKAIKEHVTYEHKKEQYILELQEELKRTIPYTLEHYELNKKLCNEYKAYICDSAIFYLSKSVEIAEHLNDAEKKAESLLNLAYLMGSTGMYKEGIDVLENINRAQLPDYLLIDYYNTYNHIYGELGYYTQDIQKKDHYNGVSYLYRDSLLSILPPDNEIALTIEEGRLRYSGYFEEAHQMNEDRLEKAKIWTPEYALLAYYRSLTYEYQGDIENQKKYLALSALSDIKALVKDHASLWMLADILYHEGDIERAYEYMRFSWNETLFYNARLRSLQSAVILSLIDKTYQGKIETQNSKLQNSLFLISILAVALVFLIIVIYRQVKRLSIARQNLEEANEKLRELNEEFKALNEELKHLNGELQGVNEQLKATNLELSESNQIKEEYIGRFIKLCSTYIDKLDSYRRMVTKRITKGQIDELLKSTRSSDTIEYELQELYNNFDTAFLQFFPDFVDSVNQLLQKDDPIILKKGELLNTELRILALIRLGINDSVQIAEFLRYSLNTIYNYRAKLKNRAVGSRDEFESQVRVIK